MGSLGNGLAMRVSPVGLWYETETEVLEVTAATIPRRTWFLSCPLSSSAETMIKIPVSAVEFNIKAQNRQNSGAETRQKLQVSAVEFRILWNYSIDTLFFKRNGPLWDEFDHLYDTLFGSSKAYMKVIEALATKKSGLTRKEILQETKLDDNGLLTEMLKNLKNSQFVRAYNTFGYGEKNVVYQLADYFTLFYLRFVKGKQNPDEHFWTNYLDNPAKSNWAGQTFEQVCKDHILQVKKAMGISALLTDISSWRGESESGKAQIDLVIDRRDRVTNICEIKFSVGEFAIDQDYEDKLRKKMQVFREATNSRNALQLVMITTYGVRQNAHSGIVQSQVRMNDLFAAPE